MNDKVTILEQNGKILSELSIIDFIPYLNTDDILRFYGQSRSVAHKTLIIEEGEDPRFIITVKPQQ
jgi:hypothetical protein